MELQFEKLAKQVLGEGIGGDGAPDAIAAQNRSIANQQEYNAGRTSYPSRYGSYTQRSDRNYGINDANIEGRIMITWKGAKTAKPAFDGKIMSLARANKTMETMKQKYGDKIADIQFSQTSYD